MASAGWRLIPRSGSEAVYSAFQRPAASLIALLSKDSNDRDGFWLVFPVVKGYSALRGRLGTEDLLGRVRLPNLVVGLRLRERLRKAHFCWQRGLFIPMTPMLYLVEAVAVHATRPSRQSCELLSESP